MPGAYAHYRFGRQVIGLFSPKQKQIIGRFRRLYDMGLYGPDIFSFAGVLHQGEVGKLEGLFHSQTGLEFFQKAIPLATTEGARAYLYGVLAHYCLDSTCGDFVEKQVRSGANACALAGEFDRYLLELDGLPTLYDRSQHMTLTRGECVTVSQFYPPASASQTHGAIGRMRLTFHFLAGANQKRVIRVMKFMGKTALVSPGQLDDAQLHRCSSLLTRYSQALKAFPQLLSGLEAETLPDIFSRPFRPGRD